MSAVCSPLAGQHHVPCIGEERDGLFTLQLTEFKGAKIAASVVTRAPPPEPAPSLGARNKAIGTIIQILDIREIDEGFELQRAAVTVIAARIAHTMIQINVSAFHNQSLKAADPQQASDQIFME